MFWLLILFIGADPNLVAGPVEKVADGFKFTEGPVWLDSGQLLFSDIPADTIYRAPKDVYRQPSNRSNGLGIDPQGRLLACEHGARRVTRTEKDGTVTVLADKFLGKRLNSPNDLAVRSDGRIYFSDPPYGLEGEAELTFSGVYTLSAQGELSPAFVYFKKPNGVALSPDEKTLYVCDAEANEVVAFDIDETGDLKNLRHFCDVPHPDGMKTDAQGNLWSTSSKGIAVFAPDGRELAVVQTPEQPANCAFGDDDLKTLYITAQTGLYRVRTVTGGWKK